MKKKLIGSIVIVALGVVLILLSSYIKNQIGTARESVQKGKSLFSNNPIGKSVGGFMENAAESKIQHYETIAKWSLYGGVVFMMVGGVLIIFTRKK